MEQTNILLVDDRTENLLSLESTLEEPGLNFVRALSGEQALEATLKHRFALIMLDVQMPGMDGFEVAKLLRGMERTRDIPIIFVTATHREDKFTFQGFESGAVDYLFKPLNAVIVRSKVKVFVDLHRKSTRLERTINELSIVNQELEAFSYSVSHDLRSPVRAILGFTQHLLEDSHVVGNPETLKTLQHVVNAGQRMSRLIDALLDLSHISRMDLQKQRVDISALAKQICEDLRQDMPNRQVDTNITQDLVVEGDRRLLDAALRNLLSNAFKFTGKLENCKIEFGARIENQKHVYYVRDNGAGFDMAYAKRLFGAFQRLHSEKDFQGTGVGLATVQRIIHRHGGRIWAESAPQAGATFYFTL